MRFVVCTDEGSYGHRSFVSDVLKGILEIHDLKNQIKISCYVSYNEKKMDTPCRLVLKD